MGERGGEVAMVGGVVVVGCEGWDGYMGEAR